jgi:hypothetical protein
VARLCHGLRYGLHPNPELHILGMIFFSAGIAQSGFLLMAVM